MDFSVLWTFLTGVISPSSLTTGSRYVATAALTWVATKLGADQSYIPAIASGIAAATVGLWGMAKSSPNQLKERTAKLADVAHVQLTNGVQVKG